MEEWLDSQNIDRNYNDVAYLLHLRENQVHYMHYLDTNAPCVASNKVWNDDQLMEHFCASDQVVFMKEYEQSVIKPFCFYFKRKRG